jgi:hypothetical protein
MILVENGRVKMIKRLRDVLVDIRKGEGEGVVDGLVVRKKLRSEVF